MEGCSILIRRITGADESISFPPIAGVAFLSEEAPLPAMRPRCAYRTIATLVLMLLLNNLTTITAAPPSDASTSTISVDENWSDDAIFNGSVIVASGATLTISSNLTVATGSSITVSDGGELVMDSATMQSEANDTWLSMIRTTASLEIPLQGIGGEVTVRLYFTAELTQGTLKAGFNGTELQDVGGDHTDLTTTLTASTNSVQIDLEAAGFIAIKISGIDVLEGSDNDAIEDLRGLDYHNMKADGVTTWNLAISSGGTLNTVSSMLNGVDLNCLGTCTLASTSMHTFAPIDLGATGSLSLDSSDLNGSITYEDVKGLLGAQIDWDANSTGTGGETDRWILENQGQTLTAPLSGVAITLEGLGYWNTSTQVSTGSDGTVTLSSRIVQWMDSSGVVSVEDSQITGVTYSEASNSWGTFSGSTGPLGTGDVTLTLNLPMISVLSVEVLDDKSMTSESVDVKATIKNDGAAATIRLSCTDSTGADVSTYPTAIPVNASAGVTIEVEFTWTQFQKGEESLICTPMIPSVFSEHQTLILSDASSATSQSTDWEAPIDPNEGGMVTTLIVVIVITIGALLYYSKRAPAKEYDTVIEEEEESAEDGSEEEEDDSEDETTEVSED